MPMNIKDYHPNWRTISRSIIHDRAQNRCELCDAPNGALHWKTKSRVILTVHHINSDKQNNNPMNLIALCQRCHLRLDLQKHISKRKKINRNKLNALSEI